MKPTAFFLFLFVSCFSAAQMQEGSRFLTAGPGGYLNDLLEHESTVQPSPMGRIALHYAFTDRFVLGLGFSAGPRSGPDSILSVSLNSQVLARRYFDFSPQFDYPNCFVELAGRRGKVITDPASYGYSAVGIAFGQTWRSRRTALSKAEIRELPWNERFVHRKNRAVSRLGLEYSFGADVVFVDGVTLLRPMVQIGFVTFLDDLFWQRNPRKAS